MRRQALDKRIQNGEYLANKPQPQQEDQQPANPMGDPAQMDVMMEGMKKNMAMMVPQMIMMGWVNYFFAGFILSNTFNQIFD
jgi:ER membrane protein complex subunit 3